MLGSIVLLLVTLGASQAYMTMPTGLYYGNAWTVSAGTSKNDKVFVFNGKYEAHDRSQLIRDAVEGMNAEEVKDWVDNKLIPRPHLLWDDAETTEKADCGYSGNTYWFITKCDCALKERDCYDCDGAVFTADGKQCTAYNSAFGRGVVAVAECTQLISEVTVKGRDDAHDGNLMVLECPEGYSMLDCDSYISTYALRREYLMPTEISKDGRKCHRKDAFPKTWAYSLYGRCVYNPNA